MNRRRRGVRLALAAASVASSATFDVHAQASIEPFTVIVGVERLMGVALESATTEPTSSTVSTQSTVSVAVLGQGRMMFVLGPTLAPRIGADVALGYGLTAGASGLYVRSSGETETTNTDSLRTESHEDATIRWFILHPRVGYLGSLDRTFSVWPRAGVTFQSARLKNPQRYVPDQTTRWSLWQLSLELLLVWSPFDGGAIVFGPVADVGLSGTVEQDFISLTTEDDIDYDGYGFVAGFALVF